MSSLAKAIVEKWQSEGLIDGSTNDELEAQLAVILSETDKDGSLERTYEMGYEEGYESGYEEGQSDIEDELMEST